MESLALDEERKKLRTGTEADSDGAGSDVAAAGQVMGECNNSTTVTEPSSDPLDNRSSPLKTATHAEAENGMSVDVVDHSTTALSVASDGLGAAVNLPSAAARSVSSSSVTDVIDVDAIDTEASCDDDSKLVGYRDPQELGLNEFYLQPATDDEPSADSVIDVDADTVDSARSLDASAKTDSANMPVAVENESSLVQDEEKSGGTEVAAAACSENGNEKSDEVGASAIEAKVQSSEPAGRSPPSSSDGNEMSPADVASGETDVSKPAAGASGPAAARESMEPAVTSSIGRPSLDAADIGEMVTEVIESAVESREQRSVDKDWTIGAHMLVEIPPRENTNNSDTERPQATANMEISAVHHTLSSDVDGKVSEVVEESCRGDEKMMLEEAAIVQIDAVNEVNRSSVTKTDSLTTDTDDKQATDTQAGTKSVAEVRDVTDTVVSDTDKADGEAEVLEMTDETVSDSSKVVSSGECVAEVKEVADKLVSGAVKVASSDESVLEVMEVSDELVSDTRDDGKSLKAVDTPVPGCDGMEEPKGIITTANVLADTENVKQHSVEIDPATGDTTGSDAEEIQQKADEVEQHIEVMDTADTLQSKAVTNAVVIDALNEAKEVTAESVTVEAKEMTDVALDDDIDGTVKDVTDSSELFEQRVETVAETEEVGDVSVSKEMLDTAAAVTDDSAKMAENVVSVDGVMKHAEVDGKKDELAHGKVTGGMCDVEKMTDDTDACLEQAGEPTAVKTKVDSDELNEKRSAQLIDMAKVDDEAGDTETAVGSVSDAGGKCGTEGSVSSASGLSSSKDLLANSVELAESDGSSPVGKVTGCEVDVELCDGETEEGGKAEMPVEPLASSDHAAE